MKPGKCSDWILRIKSIEKEYRVATLARDALDAELKKAPSTLVGKGLERLHFDRFSDNLDATYLIRMFAEFETGLRDCWKKRLKKRSIARVSDLVISISSKQRIDSQERENVEKVRRYRNKLIHEEDSEAETVDVAAARKLLCTFFGRLPEDW